MNYDFKTIEIKAEQDRLTYENIIQRLIKNFERRLTVDIETIFRELKIPFANLNKIEYALEEMECSIKEESKYKTIMNEVFIKTAEVRRNPRQIDTIDELAKNLNRKNKFIDLRNVLDEFKFILRKTGFKEIEILNILSVTRKRLSSLENEIKEQNENYINNSVIQELKKDRIQNKTSFKPLTPNKRSAMGETFTYTPLPVVIEECKEIVSNSNEIQALYILKQKLATLNSNEILTVIDEISPFIPFGEDNLLEFLSEFKTNISKINNPSFDVKKLVHNFSNMMASCTTDEIILALENEFSNMSNEEIFVTVTLLEYNAKLKNEELLTYLQGKESSLKNALQFK